MRDDTTTDAPEPVDGERVVPLWKIEDTLTGARRAVQEGDREEAIRLTDRAGELLAPYRDAQHRIGKLTRLPGVERVRELDDGTVRVHVRRDAAIRTTARTLDARGFDVLGEASLSGVRMYEARPRYRSPEELREADAWEDSR